MPRKGLPLRSRRVHLRDFRTGDLPLYETWLGPGHEWQNWDAPYLGIEEDWIRRHLESVREGVATGDWRQPRQRLVVADAETDRLIGVVTRYWISKASRWLAIGIDIYDPSRWGKGLGEEALTLWCDYLLSSMPDLRRLDLRTWSGNERMIRLARKLGFREEGRFREAREVGGKTYDALVFGILRSEWEASRKASRAARDA